MPPFLGPLLSRVSGPLMSLLKIVAPIAIVAVLSFFMGKSACKSEYQRKAAQEAAAWAEKIRVAEAQAYREGLQAAQIEARNEREAERIVRDAGMEAVEEDVCISEDALDRIRQLQ